ncbi:head-tail connector protein [Variovorax sp. H27-G14]|uniref:head-tail connector protein n=1 Tax=Variovorax sp. H27-G14 TaxID=3111914 RepID=UPI0038FBEAFE
MVKIDLAAAKVHLRVDDGTEENSLIEVWIKAAYLAVEGKIFRKVYGETVPAEDLTGVLADEAINSAVLLILGHLYVHREAVQDGTRVEVPMGAEWLLTPYINFEGGA